MKPIFAWHFVGNTLRDGSPIPKDGEWLSLDSSQKLKMCQVGYHASLHPQDALTYAPGNTLCYVEVRGRILYEDDKLVAEQRKIIIRKNIEKLLYFFARQQALSCIHNWKAPQIAQDYLKTGHLNLRSAAESAAKSAACAAAWHAACSAACSAAESAAWHAARSAAWYAARSAACSAAKSAEKSAARSAAESAAKSAACSAAWHTARSAAESAAKKEFEVLVKKEFNLN